MFNKHSAVFNKSPVTVRQKMLKHSSQKRRCDNSNRGGRWPLRNWGYICLSLSSREKFPDEKTPKHHIETERSEHQELFPSEKKKETYPMCQCRHWGESPEKSRLTSLDQKEKVEWGYYLPLTTVFKTIPTGKHRHPIEIGLVYFPGALASLDVEFKDGYFFRVY